MWTADSEGHFVDDSPSWRQFTGQSVEQWLGQGWLAAIHPDDREYAGHQWRAAVEQGDNVQTQFRVWHAASGEWRLTWARARPLHDVDGSVRGWVGMTIDLTALPPVPPEPPDQGSG